MTTSTSKSLTILAMGGTIDKVYFDALSEYQIGGPAAKAILESLPLSCSIDIKSVVKKDSLDLNDGDRKLLCAAVKNCVTDLIVITHGTDTMTTSAQFIEDFCMQENLNKTIVFTGAMQPALFKNSDASFNLGIAIGAAQSLPTGIYIAMSGQVATHKQLKKDRDAGLFITS